MLDKVLKLTRPIGMPAGAGVDDAFPPLNEITLREPRAGEIIDSSADPNAVRQQVALLGRLIRRPAIVVRRMALADFNEACAFLNTFTARPVIEDSPAPPYALTLESPIDGDDGAELKQLTIREPTIDDMIAAAETGGSRLAFDAALLSRSTQIDLPTIKRLAGRDFMKALGVLLFFLAPPPETGPTSSPT